MLGELAPVGAMESMLAERVVSLSWRLQRVERIQNETFDALLTPDTSSPLAKLKQSLLARGTGRPAGEPGNGDGASELALGRMAIKDFSNSRVLDRLLMYERRIEHSLYRTMAELHRLRLLRDLDAPAEEPAPEPAPPAAEDQLCKTKPISPSPDDGQLPCSKGVRENPPQSGLGETKPISRVEIHDDLRLASSGKQDVAPLRGIPCFG
jgi:hypothetical protein